MLRKAASRAPVVSRYRACRQTLHVSFECCIAPAATVWLMLKALRNDAGAARPTVLASLCCHTGCSAAVALLVLQRGLWLCLAIVVCTFSCVHVFLCLNTPPPLHNRVSLSNCNTRCAMLHTACCALPVPLPSAACCGPATAAAGPLAVNLSAWLEAGTSTQLPSPSTAGATPHYCPQHAVVSSRES